MKDFPEKERKLWLSFEQKPFELQVAMENVTAAKVTELLDCAAYYTLMRLPLPSNRDTMIHNMMDEQFIREMFGNVIINQDLTSHGSGPIMEVFDTRVESSNPGNLLVDVNRIIDTARHSRNESMASFLRIVRICGERGSGFDRMEEGMSDLMIPAPKVETGEDFARIKLYWYENLNEWSREDIFLIGHNFS